MFHVLSVFLESLVRSVFMDELLAAIQQWLA